MIYFARRVSQLRSSSKPASWCEAQRGERHAISFLRRFHPSTPWALASFGPGDNEIGPARTFDPTEEDAARRYIDKLQGKRNIYFTVNRVGGKPTKKVSKRHIEEVHWLHADVDLNKQLDWSDPVAVVAERARVLDRLRSYAPPPTAVVWSGGGFQAFWRLSEVIVVNGDKDLMRPIESRMQHIAKALGADACHNVDRIMRLPGTLNVLGPPKLKAGRKPALAELVEFHDDRIYDLEDFPELESPTTTRGAQCGPELERIRAALRFIPADSYDVYLRIGMALKAELGDAGFALYREWAMGSVKFDDAEIRRKWSSITPEGGITIATLFGLARDHGWRGEPTRLKPHDPHHLNGHGGELSDRFGETGVSDNTWPAPKPLPNGLAPVAPLDLALLPESVAPWIGDIADRMQCPPDLVAVPAMTALGSVLGRKLGIRPQRLTPWMVVPNIWGGIVARPGAMKSPAMEEALKPLKRLEIDARKKHDASRKAYEGELEIFKIKRSAAKTRVKEGAKASVLLELEEPAEPKAKRYSTNDTSYEKLGEILAENGRGILVVRDELVSLLRTLDREENAAARGFYQTGWNGTTGYSFDRIMRGSTHVDGVCISVFGAAQPGALSEFVRHAVAGGSGDDGLIQRFGLLAWPDQGGADWRNVDRWTDSAARDAAWAAFQRLDELTPDAAGAQHDEFEPVPFLRFDDAAHDVFLGWRQDLEGRLRSDELHPALVSHFSKYRKLIPALALINHLTDGGSGSIGVGAVLRATAFAGYLTTHAHRVYGAGTEGETAAAKAILRRIRKDDLQDGFSARDIYRAAWSSLSDRGQVQSGLDLLADLDWVRAEHIPTGGRAKVLYRINPRALQ